MHQDTGGLCCRAAAAASAYARSAGGSTQTSAAVAASTVATASAAASASAAAAASTGSPAGWRAQPLSPAIKCIDEDEDMSQSFGIASTCLPHSIQGNSLSNISQELLCVACTQLSRPPQRLPPRSPAPPQLWPHQPELRGPRRRRRLPAAPPLPLHPQQQPVWAMNKADLQAGFPACHVESHAAAQHHTTVCDVARVAAAASGNATAATAAAVTATAAVRHTLQFIV